MIPAQPSGTVLVANPGLDRYGSDLQMTQSVAGLRAAGWRVVVVASAEGPLRGRLESLGAEVRVVGFPVVRRADTTPGGAVRLAAAMMRALPGMRSVMRSIRPDVVYVNTVTLPWWLIAARLSRVPALCHVHESERDTRPSVGRVLTGQLLLARVVVANSDAALQSLLRWLPRLRARCRRLYNGVEGPPHAPRPRRTIGTGPVRLTFIGRLSPRKSPDTALEAVAFLSGRGREVRLTVCGTPVPGQEEYAETLRDRAARADLAGLVEFAGYVSPVWPALAETDVFLAPSTGESLGNTVIEAQLAGVPVVATAVDGHLETVLPELTGLMVPVGDAPAMADAVERLADDPALADALSQRARQRATEVFGPDGYRREIVEIVTRTARS